MAGIEELLVSIVSKFDDAGFKQLDKSTMKTNKATSILTNSLRSLFIATIGTIGVNEIIQATVKMDSLRTSMNALAGTELGGAEQIEYIRKETDRLGQSFISTAEAYKNLYSAGKGAGMNNADVQSIFSGVLEAGTVLGSSEQQLHGALVALEQMISKGKVSTQELRLQLGNALPGAMQIAARAMKVTNKEFQVMLENGLDSQKFVMAFADELHREFGEKAVGASHTLRAELARLQNGIFNLETSLLDGDAGSAFADTIRELTEVLRSEEFLKALNDINKVLAFAIRNWKLLGEILIAVGISKFIHMLVAATIRVIKFTKAGLQILRMAKRFGALNTAIRVFAKLGIKGLVGFIPVIGDIALSVWLLIDAIKAAIDWWKKLHDLGDEKPDWQPTSDGRYTDVNPKSKTFKQMGKEYSSEELYDWIQKGKPYEFKYDSDRFPYATYGGMMSNPNPIKQQNSITINKLEINTKEDDTNGIVSGIRNELTKIIDNFGKAQGYGRTVFSDRY